MYLDSPRLLNNEEERLGVPSITKPDFDSPISCTWEIPHKSPFAICPSQNSPAKPFPRYPVLTTHTLPQRLPSDPPGLQIQRQVGASFAENNSFWRESINVNNFLIYIYIDPIGIRCGHWSFAPNMTNNSSPHVLCFATFCYCLSCKRRSWGSAAADSGDLPLDLFKKATYLLFSPRTL